MPVIQLTLEKDYEAVQQGGPRELHVLARLEFPAPQMSLQRPPVHLALVLDRSGSMAGQKLELTKQAAVHFMNWLTRRDYLTVVTYDDTVELLVPHTPLTDKRPIAEKIRAIFSGGQTNLSGGWTRALAELLAHQQPGELHRVILLTDGRANSGVTSREDLSAIAAKNRERNVATTTVGFGADFDEQLLKAIAETGGGRFHYVSEAEGVAQAFQNEFGELAAIVAQNVECHLDLAEGAAIADVLTDLPCTRSERTLQVRLGDARASDVKLVLVKVRAGESLCARAGRAALGRITARCDTLSGEMLPESQSAALEVEVREGAPPPANREVRREVWLAEGARLKLAAAQHLDKGQVLAAARDLRRHADAAAAMAKDPTEQLVRDEIERLLDWAQRAEAAQDLADDARERTTMSKILTHSSSMRTSVRGVYTQFAGVKTVRAQLSPRRPEEIGDVVLAVQKELRARNYETDRADRVRLVLHELLDNAITHGCAGRPEGIVRAECDITDSYARVVVSDDGPGFDYAAKLKWEEEHAEAPEPHGRGLLLVKRLADRVSWQTDRGARVEAVVEKHGLQIAAQQAPQSAVGAGVGRSIGIEEETDQDKGIVTLKLQGALKAHTLARLEAALAGLLQRGYYKIIVDVSRVRLMTSAGAGVFMAPQAQVRQHGGQIVLVCPPGSIRDVFSALGLSRTLRICDDLATAYSLF